MARSHPHPAIPYWPLFGLTLRTERLELTHPTDEDCVELAELAARGIHDPDWMPFSIPWTRVPSPELERSALQHYWAMRGKWSPQDWNCVLVTKYDGEIVGTQDFGAKDFSTVGVVGSGSWIGRAHQGRGFGKEQRAAMLHLAFAGLGARRAQSAAREDNGPSIGVSRSLGYEENGDYIEVNDGRPVRLVKFLLTRERWEARRTLEVEVSGLEPCLELFGAASGVEMDPIA